MTVDAGRRLLFLGVILWLGHQDCRALLPTAPTDQHVQIVLLHRRGLDCNADSDNKIANSVSLSASQREMAARWASEILNNKTTPHLFSIDVEVMDTCGSVQATAKRSLQVVRQIKSSGTAVLGVIALEEADVLAEAARVLRRHNIPLVVATPRAAESEAASLLLYAPDDPAVFTQPDNVFSAVPNTAAVARATMAVAKGIQCQSIRILGTCWRTIRMAERAARHLNIRVTAAEHFIGDYSGSATAYISNLTLHQHLLEQQDGVRVALLMEPNELTEFMSQAVRISSGRKITWLLGCVAGAISPQTAAQWALDLSSSAFLVEPHLQELAGLADYMRLHGVVHHPLDNEIPHIVQAVSALGAAFHLQELSRCVQIPSANGTGDDTTNEFDCSPKLNADPSRVPSQMLTALRQLSMPATSSSRGPAELEGTSNHFTPSGRLVANRYLIQKLMAGSGESSPVAWYSDDDGLVLAAVMTSQSRFDFFGHASSVPLLNSVPPFVIDERTVDYNVDSTDDPEQDQQEPTGGLLLDDVDNLITASPSSRPLFLFVQGRTWAASILAVSATELLAAFYILIVLVSRMCGTDRATSIRLSTSQTMSLLLLLAVMAQLMSVALFVLPGLATYLKFFLPPLFLVTGYALLLAKLFQFRHLASAGLGGSVPQCPLYVAVLLAVAVQAAVSAHFYTQQEQQRQFMTTIETDNNNNNDLPLLYLFLMVLVTVTALYASSLKHIRQQHREAQLILIATLTSATLMLAWALAVTLGDQEYRDAATAGLLVLLAASVLGSIFIPRVVQLSRQRRQLSIKSTYACNISMASGIPTSPWLDYNFANNSAKDPKWPPQNYSSTNHCSNSYNSNSNSYKSSSSNNNMNNSNNLTNDVKLSGSGLMRHPAYSGRH